MTVLDVAMGQAIVVSNMEGHTLSTGNGQAADVLQSCSAVIVYNTAEKSAGLYHYPAGDIAKRPQACELLQKMKRMVKPTGACVVYGVLHRKGATDTIIEGTPSDLFLATLTDYLAGLLKGVAVERKSASKSACATIEFKDGAFAIDTTRIAGATDLSTDKEPGAKNFPGGARGQILWALDQTPEEHKADADAEEAAKKSASKAIGALGSKYD